MQLLKDQAALEDWRRAVPVGEEVVLVPTMGALHRGHASLIEHAAAAKGRLLVSIFVNPLQFERAEDLASYPETLEDDLALLDSLGVDAVYLPPVADMYPEGQQVGIDPGPAAGRLEGAARPGHFAGMLTVVHKLFARCRPHQAWFGEKDAQQLFLVRRMVQDLDMPVAVHGCPTYREDDGLAFSSRNVHLDEEARRDALVLWRSLNAAREAFEAGQRNPRALEERMLAEFVSSPAQLAYAQVVSDLDFDLAAEGVPGPWRAVVGARLGAVHLLDNLLLGQA